MTAIAKENNNSPECAFGSVRCPRGTDAAINTYNENDENDE